MFRTKFDRRGQQQADTAIIHPKEIGRSDTKERRQIKLHQLFA
jgi:hypothetical protein